MSNKYTLKLETLLVFSLSIFLFIYGLFTHIEFVQFESRFALFAQEMLRNGFSFFPTTYNLPYPDYPATQTILITAIANLFNGGKLSILTAVLPSAIASALIVALTYKLAARYSRSWGVAAVLCELASYEFFTAARTLSLDPFVTLATIWAFYAAYTARYWSIFLALICGFVFRGPIGLVIPTGVVVIFFAIEMDWQKLWRTTVIASGLLIIGLLFLLWAAWYQGGVPFAEQVLHMQIWGRFSHSDTAYPFYYLLNSLASYAIAFPLACLVGGGLITRLWSRELTAELRLIRHAIAWILVVLLGMSIPSTHKIRYVLPMLPAAALVAGYLFIVVEQPRWLVKLRQGIARICYILPLMSLPIIPATLIVAQMKGLTLHTHALFAIILLVLTMLIVLLIGFKIRQQPRRDLLLFGCGVFVFMVLNIFIVEPLNLSTDQAQPFVTQVRQKWITQQPIIFYQIEPDAEAIKFMTALDEPLQPLFAKVPEQISHYAPAIIIAKQTDFANLPGDLKNRTTILVQGKVGHRSCVAFKLED